MAKKNQNSKPAKLREKKAKKVQKKKTKKANEVGATNSGETIEGMEESLNEASLLWMQREERGEVYLIDYDKFELQT